MRTDLPKENDGKTPRETTRPAASGTAEETPRLARGGSLPAGESGNKAVLGSCSVGGDFIAKYPACVVVQISPGACIWVYKV